MIVPDPMAVVQEVLDRATPYALSSSRHGPAHWRRVGLTGARLLKRVPEADAELVFLFSVLHDSQRVRSWYDSGHGPRAARLVRELDGGLIHLSEDQHAQLIHALRDHERGVPSDDPTVGVCWDADRLNVHKSGIWPRAKYLSTAAAKKRGIILWAYELQRRSTTWGEVVESYGLQRGCAMR